MELSRLGWQPMHCGQAVMQHSAIIIVPWTMLLFVFKYEFGQQMSFVLLFSSIHSPFLIPLLIEGAINGCMVCGVSLPREMHSCKQMMWKYECKFEYKYLSQPGSWILSHHWWSVTRVPGSPESEHGALSQQPAHYLSGYSFIGQRGHHM